MPVTIKHKGHGKRANEATTMGGLKKAYVKKTYLDGVKERMSEINKVRATPTNHAVSGQIGKPEKTKKIKSDSVTIKMKKK